MGGRILSGLQDCTRFWVGITGLNNPIGLSDRVRDFIAYNSTVAKISSFRVNAVSGRGIVQQGSSFVSIFFLFSIIAAAENRRSSPLSYSPV